MKIGAVIQQERTRLGLSQEKLAEQLGVSRQAVSKWELGDAVPDTDKLVPLARALGISVDTLLDNQTPQAEEKPTETGERQPGWLALHWYWIGVPLSLWGAARSSVVFSAMNMTGFAISFLVFLPYLLLPLSALVGGLALFVQGRRSVRRRYSLKPLTPPPWKGPRELIARRWYWLGALLAGGSAVGCALWMAAAQALYDRIQDYQQNVDMYQEDALWEYIAQVPEEYLNGQAYEQVTALRNQGLLMLTVGVVLGSILFFLGRWLVCRCWKENEEKSIAK